MTKDATARAQPTLSPWLYSTLAPAGTRRACRIVAFLAVAAELSVPPIVGYCVARAVGGSALHSAVWLPVLAAVVLSGVLSGVRTALLSRTTAREMRTLRHAVARHLITLPPRHVEQIGVDEAVTLYTRYADEVEPMLTAERIRRRVAAATVVACLLLMTVFEWRLSLTLLLVLMASALIVTVALRGLKDRGQQALSALSRTSGDLGEYLRSVRSAKIYGLESDYLNRLDTNLAAVLDVEERVGRAQALCDVTVKIASLLALLAIGGVGAALVASGTTSVARLAGFLAALALLLGPASQYAEMLQRRRLAMAALPKLNDLAEAPREEDNVNGGRETTPSSVGAEVTGLALDGAVMSQAAGACIGPVSFRAARGQTVCLVGPSGSGKSTVLAAIAGFLPVHSGQVQVGERAVEGWDAAQLRGNIAYVEQGAPIIGSTVRQFLTVGEDSEPLDERLGELLDAVGLSGRLAELGLDTPIERAGTSLSGGERQRLSIVRALASDRAILLLDEPTGHLDRVSEAAVLHLLEMYQTSRVIVIATHSPALIERANTVVQLVPPSTLATSPVRECLPPQDLDVPEPVQAARARLSTRV